MFRITDSNMSWGNCQLRTLLTLHKYGALRDLVPFVQFKKREKHPWRVLILVKLQAITNRFKDVRRF